MQTKNRGEYQDLELESSILIMDADSKYMLGKFPVAAYRFLEAGRMRSQMGQISYDDSQFANAAADWLSATACFLQATNLEQAQNTMELDRGLRDDGKIPDDRRDIHVALKEREEELKQLEERIDEFFCTFAERGDQLDTGDEETLEFLLSQVRELPGLPALHYAIYNQAISLNRMDRAFEAIKWAAVFDPENANYAALLGYQYLDSGDADRAEAVGRDFLEVEPSDVSPVRIMLASALASAQRSDGPERLEAIALLNPIVASDTVPFPLRFSAMSLCALYHAELGHKAEATNLLNDIESVATDIGDQEALRNVDKFRRLLPGVLEQSGNGSVSSLMESTERKEWLAETRILAAA